MFRAYHPEQDRLVAVKLFRLDLPPERVHQLVASLEQLIVADLTHPGIAAPVAAGVSDVSAYLAQDFVAADSLDIIVRDGGHATPADAMRAIAQLASALDFAADAGVVHGSLHPRDVLMSVDDVRVTGLGIARALEGVGVAPPVRRPYTAPERLGGAAWDRRADVFSLAALAFELLTGRRIAGPGEPPTDAFAVLTGASRQALGRVFGRALESDPSDRFATATDFAKALETALDVRPASRAVSPRRKPVVDDAPPVVPPLPVEELPLLTEAMLSEEPAEEPVAASATGEPAPLVESAALAADLDVVNLPDPMADALRLSGRDPEPVLELPLAPEASSPTAWEVPDVETADTGAPPDRAEPSLALGTTTEESGRSAVWPIALALVVGIAIGFGSAMLVVGRAAPSGAAAVAMPSAARPAPTPINDEPVRAVGEPVRPVEAPASVAPPTPAPVAPAPSAASAAPAQRLAGRPEGPRPSAARSDAARPRAARKAADAKPAAQETRSGPGSLTVDSRPAGAEVFLDGKSIGKTPVGVVSASAGDHAIHLDLAGYKRWATSVRIVSGERSRVAASLER